MAMSILDILSGSSPRTAPQSPPSNAGERRPAAGHDSYSADGADRDGQQRMSTGVRTLPTSGRTLPTKTGLSTVPG